MRIVLCTGNRGKVAELRAMLPPDLELFSLSDVGIALELPENGETLEANALEKARYAYAICGLPCLADDTGLEVDALNGAPGVWSARYAGEQKDAMANMRKLLTELAHVGDRGARFRTVLAYVGPGVERTFEGRVEGTIGTVLRGDGGFGYDPLFIPDGEARTFAELDIATKNRISHRGRALQQWLLWMRGSAH